MAYLSCSAGCLHLARTNKHVISHTSLCFLLVISLGNGGAAQQHFRSFHTRTFLLATLSLFICLSVHSSISNCSLLITSTLFGCTVGLITPLQSWLNTQCCWCFEILHGLLSNKNIRIPTPKTFGAPLPPALCYTWADKGGYFQKLS